MIQTSYGTITITDTTDIDRIENYYLATSHSSGVTTENGDWGNWTTTVQTMTSTKQYLWNYEKILGTGDVVINTTDPVIIGRYGQNGGTGAAGRGISSIVEYYNTTTTAVKPTSTTGFTTEIKQVDSTNKYLWNYEVINYTSGNPTTTDIRLIGVYGDSGDDAYTVILDNDSHVFSAGVSAATATVITVKVIAYKGTTPIAANIGTITGQAAGLTTTLVNNKTTDAGFKITVTANLTTKSGVLTIPITVDGQSFTRKFSWSLALTGQTGTSVSSTIKYYQLATSKPQRPINNEAISSDWTTTQPTFDQTKMEYTLYSVIQTVYSNGNITYSEVQIESSFEAAKIAYENSISALTSADGKNTIYHQTSQPSDGVYQDGDVWFDTNDGNKIYIWNASTSKWVATQFGVNAIADLAITNAKIANGTIQNAKIANLDAGKITTGDLDALRIKAHVISAVNSSTETSGGSSLKIAADKVNIEGAAIFTNGGRLSEASLDAAYDAKGAASAVQTNLDNLEIGGRNLLIDTNAPSLTKIAAKSDRYWSNGGNLAEDGTAEFFEVTDAPVAGIKYGVRLSATVERTEERLHGLTFYQQGVSRLTFEVGQAYTMSCYIRLASGDANRFSLGLESGSSWTDVSHKYFTSTSNWQRISRTFIPETQGANKAVYFQMCYLNIGVIEVCGFKVEKGNKPTDWTPAPEDIDNVIAEIKQTADAAAPKSSAVAKTQRIYYRSNSATKPTAYPTTWVIEEGDKWNSNATTANGWSRKVTPISNGTGANVTKYLYLWTATQKQMVNDTVAELTADDIALDDSTTVIDGGKIITGSIKANQIDANAITAEKIHAEAVTLGKLGSDVTNSINDAGKTASNYIAADETGLMVAKLTNNGGNYTSSTIRTGNRNVFIDNNSLDIRDGQNVLASFGENTIIGNKEDSRIELSSDNIFGYHKDHGEFFKFSGNGYSTVVQNHSQVIFNESSQNIPYGTEEGWSFTLAHVPVTDRPFYLDIRPQPIEDFDPCNQYGVIAAGTMVWKWEIDPLTANGQTFGTGVHSYVKKRSTQQILDFDIDFMYNPNTGEIFNIKATDPITSEKIPGLSFSAYYKTLESASTFSLGEQNNITGAYSIGIGLGLEAAYANQLVIGQHNENYEHSLFEIGNGSDVLNRDTIFRIDAAQGLQLKSDANISGTMTVGSTDLIPAKIDLLSSKGKMSFQTSANNTGIWDTTNGLEGYWLLAHKFSNDHAYIGKHLEVPYNATILSQKMVYEAGDSISCDGLQCAGHLTTSKTDVTFFIPLPKPTGSNLKATVSGNWTIRHADGGYILNGAALTSIGTLASVAIYDLGVYVRIRLTTASSFANNSALCVSGSSTAKVTFSANS